MGSCCCCEESAEKKPLLQKGGEDNARNPLPAHENWEALVRNDIGKDVGSVCRDFPRIRVSVGEGEEWVAIRPDDFAKRNERIKANMLKIAKLVGEEELAATLESKWEQHIPKHATDISAELLVLFQECAMVKSVIDVEPVHDDAEEGEGRGESNDGKTKQGKEHLIGNCSTFRVLAHLVQGVMFFPSQRMLHLVWFPWATCLRDVGWSTRLFHREGTTARSLIVLHEQSTRNYVEDGNAKDTPQFQITYELEIRLEDTTAEWKGASLKGVNLVVKKPTSSPSQLWTNRYDMLARRASQLWEITPQMVKTLPQAV